MNEKLERVKSLIIESRKLLLQVLEENTAKDPKYNNTYTDKIYDVTKILLDATRKLD